MSNATESNRRWRQTHPAAHKAETKVAGAIRFGHLTRLPCEVCGEPKSHAHHDDYSKPLDVRWLCPVHHKEHHFGKPCSSGPKRSKRREPIWPNRLKYQPAPRRSALIETAKLLYSTGASYRTISRQLGTVPSQIYKWLNPKDYG